MTELQPSKIQEGDQAPSAVPGTNHSQSAVLNAMDGDKDNQTSASNTTAALSKAMKSLDINGGNSDSTKIVKPDMADVILLAENLDVSRSTAMELLRANDADPVRAMRAWIVG